MEAIRSYLISVVAVCMVASITGVFIKNPIASKAVRLVSGILILLVVISPLLGFDFEDISDYIDSLMVSDLPTDDEVVENAHRQLALQIKSSTEAYIENYAQQKGMLVQIEVRMNEEEVPTPTEIEITGTLTPDEIAELSAYIEQTIGITKDEQKWRLYEVSN